MKNNVYTKVQTKFKKYIIGLHCYAYVLHNATQCAADSLSIDVDIITVKLFGYILYIQIRYPYILAHIKTK